MVLKGFDPNAFDNRAFQLSLGKILTTDAKVPQRSFDATSVARSHNAKSAQKSHDALTEMN